MILYNILASVLFHERYHVNFAYKNCTGEGHHNVNCNALVSTIATTQHFTRTVYILAERNSEKEKQINCTVTPLFHKETETLIRHVMLNAFFCLFFSPHFDCLFIKLLFLFLYSFFASIHVYFIFLSHCIKLIG